MFSQQTRCAGKRAPRRLEAREEARASSGQAWVHVQLQGAKVCLSLFQINIYTDQAHKRTDVSSGESDSLTSSKTLRLFIQAALEPTGWQTDEQYWLMLLQGHAFLPHSRRQIPLQWHTDILSVFGTCAVCSISLCSISSNVKLSSIIDVGAQAWM